MTDIGEPVQFRFSGIDERVFFVIDFRRVNSSVRSTKGFAVTEAVDHDFVRDVSLFCEP